MRKNILRRLRWSKTEFNYMSDDVNTGGAAADDDENF